MDDKKHKAKEMLSVNEANLNFLSDVREGKFANIQTATLDVSRTDDGPMYLDTEEKEYYYSFS